jgi:acetylornithine/N-succinyldiaminopimelate aminotransferase
MTADSLMSTYARTPFAVASGQGVWLTDTDSRTYLDCVQGIASNALGHAHPRLVSALTEQAGRLWHVSNIFRVPGQEELARRLTEATFADVVFFANSGTEAVEAALKGARRHHADAGRKERIDIIGFAGSFHGRTYGAINASGNPSYLDGFGPRLPGFVQLSIDDEAGLDEALARPTAAAVIVEPVQGEGGARALSGEWLLRLRERTRAHGVLLIYDEVQSGMGRTGKLFAHQWFEGVEPDIMTVAKALGSGFPVGACLATTNAASGMAVGVHGTTFGGNPLAMAVALAAFDEISSERLLANACSAAAYFQTRLEALCELYPDIALEVRGKGLLVGLKLVPNNREFMALAREHGLLVAGGGENIIRLLPPLNITTGEIDEVVSRLSATCEAARTRLSV